MRDIVRGKRGFLILWTGVVMAGYLLMGPQGAQGVGPPEAAKATAPAPAAAKPAAAAAAGTPAATAPAAAKPALPATAIKTPAAAVATPTAAKPAAPATVSAPAATAPAVKVEEIYSYSPAGKTDPFKPFVDLEVAKRKTAEKKSILSVNPLQRQGVEQFKLVGIIGDNKNRRAMVQDSTGKFYSLVPGAYIGLNKGRVSKILSDSVIVDEKIRTDDGRIKSQKSVINLRQGEGKP